MRPIPFSLSYTAHGGQTCGRSHLFGFAYGRWAQATRVRVIEEGIERCLRGNYSSFHGDFDKFSHCIEVCLNAWQAKQWEPALLECGFEKVKTFKNSKTKNEINVYLFVSGQR